MWRELRLRVRPPPRHAGGKLRASDARSLQQLCGDLLRATEQIQRVSLSLLRREAWDFTCIVFGAAHRAGHYLWDLNQARDALTVVDANQRALLVTALERIYEAIDDALGELIAQVGADARVMVFSLHGMGPNGGWSEIVPRYWTAADCTFATSCEQRGALLNTKTTGRNSSSVLQMIPPQLAARLVPLWTSRMFDWQRTQYFPLPMDLTALMRINLQGAGTRRIVSPGGEYEAVCHRVGRFLPFAARWCGH